MNLNLREVHGYTYGAGSGFMFRRAQGPFQISTMVRTDASAPSVTEIFRELDRMRGSEPAPDEVTMAKESYVRSLPAIFETRQQTAAALADLFIYNLPLQYYAQLTKQIKMVDTAKVHQVAQRYLSPDRMVVVIAGDRAKIQEELKRLDPGPIEVVDVEGQPVKSPAAPPEPGQAPLWWQKTDNHRGERSSPPSLPGRLNSTTWRSVLDRTTLLACSSDVRHRLGKRLFKGMRTCR